MAKHVNDSQVKKDGCFIEYILILIISDCSKQNKIDHNAWSRSPNLHLKYDQNIVISQNINIKSKFVIFLMRGLFVWYDKDWLWNHDFYERERNVLHQMPWRYIPWLVIKLSNPKKLFPKTTIPRLLQYCLFYHQLMQFTQKAMKKIINSSNNILRPRWSGRYQ